MPAVTFEARKAYSESTEYISPESLNLECSVETISDIPNGKLMEARIKNRSEAPFLGCIHIKLSIDKKNPQFFMPGYMYGNNTADMPNHGRKEFPRILEGATTRPESYFWMTRSDRLAEPMSIIYDGGRIVAIAAEPYFKDERGNFTQYAGFTCSTNPDGTATVGYTIGYENAPYLFIQTATVLERAPLTEDNSFKIKPDEEITIILRVYDYEAENELGIYKAMKDAYLAYHEAPRSVEGMTVKKAAELLSMAIKDYAWLEDEKMYTGFVYDKPGGNRSNKIGSLSWTNGMAVACPMLMAANRLKDEEMRNQALTFIDQVVNHSLNPASGLLFDAVADGVWSTKGWWYSGMHSGGHSGYINGQAIYYILKSYVSESEQQHANHEDWLEFVRPIIYKLNEIKNTDGEYPFSMSEKTGAGIEYDSLGGVWCLAATALYCKITGKHYYLDGLKLSEQHYYDTFIKKAVCYGGPLDTDKAVDNEGILAYVRAARILHEITGKDIYLDHLRDGLYYEFSFKLGYNTPVKVKPLSDIGWSSSGGSITSVANPHIHPMSSTVVDEMIYLLKYREDEYVQSRLKDTIGWGLQTFNSYEKEYGYGRIGWMSERFCFCQGLMTESYPDGSPASTWFALMPWASASVIEGFVGDCWE